MYTRLSCEEKTPNLTVYTYEVKNAPHLEESMKSGKVRIVNDLLTIIPDKEIKLEGCKVPRLYTALIAQTLACNSTFLDIPEDERPSKLLIDGVEIPFELGDGVRDILQKLCPLFILLTGENVGDRFIYACGPEVDMTNANEFEKRVRAAIEGERYNCFSGIYEAYISNGDNERRFLHISFKDLPFEKSVCAAYALLHSKRMEDFAAAYANCDREHRLDLGWIILDYESRRITIKLGSKVTDYLH